MCRIATVVLHSLIAQVAARDFALSDQFMDKLVNKLVDKLIGVQMPLASRGVATFNSPLSPSPMVKVHAIQDQLAKLGMPSSPMQELALAAMASTRDVRAAASFEKLLPTLPQKDYRKLAAATRDIKVMASQAPTDGGFTPANWVDPAETKANTGGVDGTVGFRGVQSTDPTLMAGVGPPLGIPGKTIWDPARFFASFRSADGKYDSTILYLREAEIKHGRVTMLACLGIFIQEKYHPLFGGKIDMPAYDVRGMLLETDVVNFWFAALVGLGALEAASVRTQYDSPFWEIAEQTDTGFWSRSTRKDERMPGDLGFDPLNLKKSMNPDQMKEMQTKEINNGRLAMLGFAGIIGQEIVTGDKVFN